MTAMGKSAFIRIIVGQTIARSQEKADAESEYKPSFVSTLRQNQHESARALLRDVLSEMGLGPLIDLKVMREESGRPVADGIGEPLDISFAHSGSWVACGATTEGRIGIDIEAVRPRPNAAAIARTYLGPAEQRLVAERGAEAFHALWTLREAFGKACGTGMEAALSLAEEHVLPGREGVHLFALAGQSWAIGHRRLAAAHLAAAWSVPDAERLAQALDAA